MAAWVCLTCTAVVPVGLPRCPEPTCDGAEFYEQGDETMAKISRAQGPTYTEAEQTDQPQVAAEQGETSSEIDASPEVQGEQGEQGEQGDAQFRGADGRPGEDEGDGAEVDRDDQSTEPSDEYGKWPYAELQRACRDRHLSATGSTKDLIGRLREDDKTRAASGGDDVVGPAH